MTDSPSTPSPNSQPDRLAELLRAIDRETAAPQEASLQQIQQTVLRELSTRAVTANPESPTSPGTAPEASASTPSTDAPSPQRGNHSHRRSTSPMRLSVRYWLAGVTGLAAALFFLSALLWQPDAQRLTLGEAFTNLKSAGSVRLTVREGDSTSEILIRQPGLVRIDDDATRGQYRIARGSRLWTIDEAANLVQVSDSPFKNEPTDDIDPLAVVGLEELSTSVTRGTRPTSRTRYGGRAALRYDTQFQKQPAVVFVDPTTKLPLAVQLFDGLEAKGEPVREVQMAAMDVPIDPELFVVADSLTEDGRLGRVMDAQGLVTLRPLASRRWTPITGEMLVRPGDWLRTDARGANACLVTLTSSSRLTIGPGSLVEFLSPYEVRLHDGSAQVEITDQPQEPFLLRGPGEEAVTLQERGSRVLNVTDKNTLLTLKNKPVWLQGFEGSIVQESLGSLIVEVDGRSTPLTIGYHHVKVEIRDQIARTTIEESFKNHTNSRLEGVFHFPLPQNASISGFGMWIGNELVEADVVEKQRAREIYETILREKRDPGLLEWTGGNQFKARVFPIEANSEKRIKITYTQVLPLRGNRYRYGYALDSELLRTNPVRDLAIDVTVSSSLPIASVTSPTHTTRIQKTDNAAQVSFSAQQYQPQRDFEMICELKRGTENVVVVPHRRGEDGYFLMQLMPPDAGGDWEREVVPEGKPLSLVILADTSASMNAVKREQQRELLAALLASLSEKDTVHLAACDVDTVWATEEPVSITGEASQTLRDFLDERLSLGWTDLDNAFAAVEEKMTETTTQVLYIGDGLISTGDADPYAFVDRLRNLFGDAKPSFHAIAVGNTTEQVSLTGIASLGGGSFRAVEGEQTPAIIARDLLTELAQPGLSDLSLEFRGLDAAAVYPGRLPNIPAGTQQIIVGRYLPSEADPEGQVIVTGKLDGKPVTFKSTITFDGAEESNSFIPRLWARAHLDQLLAQGRSQFIQDEIIALSEEFNIITPYTSLLVLESDADRERFGVKKRYRMRDGERFFAKGRDEAEYELIQQQMRLAGSWRIGLRNRILKQFGTLQRRGIAVPTPRPEELSKRNLGRFGRDNYLGDFSGAVDAPMVVNGPVSTTLSFTAIEEERSSVSRDKLQLFAGTEIRTKSRGLYEWQELEGFLAREEAESSDNGLGLGRRSGGELDSRTYYMRNDVQYFPDAPGEPDPVRYIEYTEGRPMNFTAMPFGQPAALSKRESTSLALDTLIRSPRGGKEDAKGWYYDNGRASLRQLEAKQQLFDEAPLLEAAREQVRLVDGDFDGIMVMDQRGDESFEFYVPVGEQVAGRRGRGYFQRGQAYRVGYDALRRIDNLFPQVPTVSPTSITKPPYAEWPEELKSILEPLLIPERLRTIDGGLLVTQATVYRDPRWNRQINFTSQFDLYASESWLSRVTTPGLDAITHYLNGERRGVYSATFSVGRSRPAIEADRTSHLVGHAISGVHSPLRYKPEMVSIKERNGDLVTLKITFPDRADGTPDPLSVEFVIDTAKNTLVRETHLNEGKARLVYLFRKHVEVAGIWWPTEIESRNEDDEITNTVTQTIESLKPQAYAKRFDQELNRPEKLDGLPLALMLDFPLPNVEEAKQAVAKGEGDLNDHFVLLLVHTSKQEWKEVDAQFAEIEKLTADKRGTKWLRMTLLRNAGRNAELREWITAEGDKLTKVAVVPPDEFAIAQRLRSNAYDIMGWNEYATVLELLKPIYERTPNERGALSSWESYWRQTLNALDRDEEAYRLLERHAKEQPWFVSLQIEFANATWNRGEREAARAWLRKQIAREVPLTQYEQRSLYDRLYDLLRNEGRVDELIAVAKEWATVQLEPSSSPYAKWLSALVFADRMPEAEQLVREWIAEFKANDEKKLPPRLDAKTDAAIAYLIGQGYNLSWSSIPPQWKPLLTDLVTFTLPGQDRHRYGNRLLNDHRVRDLLGREWLTKQIRETLENVDAERSVYQIRQLVQWLRNYGDEMNREKWAAIAKPLEALYADTGKGEEEESRKLQLGYVLIDVYQSGFGTERVIEFHQRRLEEEAEQYRLQVLREYYAALLGQREWEEDRIAKLLDLFPRLDVPVDFELDKPLEPVVVPQDLTEEQRKKLAESYHRHLITSALMITQTNRLDSLIDALIETKKQTLSRTLEADREQDALTRKEYAERKQQLDEDSRTAAIEVLTDWRAELTKTRDAAAERSPNRIRLTALIERMNLELSTLHTQNGEQQKAVLARMWELLGKTPPELKVEPEQAPEPPKPRPVDAKEDEKENERDDEPITLDPIAGTETLLKADARRRALQIVLHIATRPSAKPPVVDRVRKYLVTGSDYEPEFVRRFWRTLLYNYLIAIDEPEALEKRLTTWIADSPFTAPWQTTLAILKAERGDVPEAITLMEAASKQNPLSSQHQALLSSWYQVVDRKEDHREAKVESFKRMSESQLSRLLSNNLNRMRNGTGVVADELMKPTLMALTALFEKSAYPWNYYGLARDLYNQTKDFRILTGVAETMLGQTPERVYDALINVRRVIDAVQDEATSDEILSHLETLRKDEELSKVDRRALDLLEALVERRASEVLNEPGPHVKAATDAMRRAFERDWEPGEKEHYSRWLYQLGNITRTELETLRMSQLKTLHRSSEPGTRERLTVSQHYANALAYQKQRRAEAILVLQSAVDAYVVTHPEGWPNQDTNALEELVNHYQSVKQHRQAEAALKRLRDPARTPQMANWFEQRILSVHENALANGSSTSLGRGEKLYTALLDIFDRKAENATYSELDDLIRKIVSTHSTAIFVKIPSAKKTFTDFAFNRLPELLPRLLDSQQNAITTTATTLEDRVSAHTALRFLITRFEQYPERFEYTYQRAWRQFGHRLAEYRSKAEKPLGELEPRLLAIVLEELRRDLRTGQRDNGAIYHDNYSYFWKEQREQFLQTANEVYAETRSQKTRVRHIASYLHEGLSNTPRAIELLFTAQSDGILDWDGRRTLVQYLFYENRHPEAIPLLEQFVKESPETIRFRTDLLIAYHRAKRPMQVAELLKSSERYYRENKTWTADTIARLASTSVSVDQWETAARLYDELIPRYLQENGGSIANGNATLSRFYERQADAHRHLGNFDQAIEAATSAVVSWGQNLDSRKRAVAVVERVLKEMPNLDGYVKTLDKRLEETGQDSPLLRKLIGNVYRSREEYEPAARNLELARELQPGDLEVYSSLIDVYGKMEQAEKVIATLLAQSDANPDDLSVYLSLEEKFRLLERTAQAERAATAIVEIAPNEAESHQMLANLRENQQRFEDAIARWKRVAELRKLEPTGLLGLAEAQLKAGQDRAARETIRTIRDTEWPERFEKEVTNKLQAFQKRLSQ